MKKILFICGFIFCFLPVFSYATYENDFYSVDDSGFIRNGDLYTDIVANDNSSISIATIPYEGGPNTLPQHMIYTQEYLDELGVSIIKEYQNIFGSSLQMTPSLEFSCITTKNNYRCFYFLIHFTQNGSPAIYMNLYSFCADNISYTIAITSAKSDYANSESVNNFLESFEIKDSVSSCSVSNVLEDSSVVGENDIGLPQIDYSVPNLIINLILTAFLYLFIPIITSFVCKQKFKSSTAFWVSFANFAFIKILIIMFFGPEYCTASSAWLYLFIGQMILTKPTSNNFDNNEDAKGEEESNIKFY